MADRAAAASEIATVASAAGEPVRSLPREYYLDRDIFEREKERI